MLQADEADEAEALAEASLFVVDNGDCLNRRRILSIWLEVVDEGLDVLVRAHGWDADEDDALVGRSGRLPSGPRRKLLVFWLGATPVARVIAGVVPRRGPRRAARVRVRMRVGRPL